MTALFAEFPSITQAHSGDGAGFGDTRRNVWARLDPHLG